MPHTLIAPPSKVVLAAVHLASDGTLLRHAETSLGRLATGLAAA